MKIHVAGGSGFLGGHVIPLLLAAGHTVSGLARSEAAAARLTRLGAAPVSGDLDHPRSLVGAFLASRADALVSLVSLGFGHAPAIVAAAEEAGLRRAIFTSTTTIDTKLEASSKATRKAAELAIQSSDLEWTIIRPTMIYGSPADRNMARLLRLVKRSPVVPVPGGGRRLVQPVHVADVAAAVVAALERAISIRRTYVVAGPEALSLSEVIRQAGAAFGRNPRIVTIPLAPAVAAARLYERMSSRPRLRAEQLQRLVEDKAFDIAAAREDLAYRPRPFHEGIRQEVAALS